MHFFPFVNCRNTKYIIPIVTGVAETVQTRLQRKPSIPLN